MAATALGVFVSIAMTTSTHSYHGYLHFTTRATTVIGSRFSIPRAIGSRRPARTWSDRALLLMRRAVSINFLRNDGPPKTPSCRIDVNQLIGSEQPLRAKGRDDA